LAEFHALPCTPRVDNGRTITPPTDPKSGARRAGTAQPGHLGCNVLRESGSGYERDTASTTIGRGAQAGSRGDNGSSAGTEAAEPDVAK